jgi:hypothetical protein
MNRKALRKKRIRICKSFLSLKLTSLRLWSLLRWYRKDGTPWSRKNNKRLSVTMARVHWLRNWTNLGCQRRLDTQHWPILRIKRRSKPALFSSLNRYCGMMMGLGRLPISKNWCTKTVATSELNLLSTRQWPRQGSSSRWMATLILIWSSKSRFKTPKEKHVCIKVSKRRSTGCKATLSWTWWTMRR